MNLSSNFSLEELTTSQTAARKGLNNSPSPEVLKSLQELAIFLEQLRTLLNKPIKINSGYRSPEVNKAIGGSSNSQHCKGQAADIIVPGMTPDQVVQAIIKSSLPYDQVIREFDSWTHVSISSKPRKQALIIDKAGTRLYK